MIRVEPGPPVAALTKLKRVKVDCPNGTTRFERMTEEEAAWRFYSSPANYTKSFTFTVYGDDDVRAALNKAFHFKCAYCESSYQATQPVAIEHYRPKGEVTVDGKPSRPGYYWLASRWDNLLPSCTDCNSHRQHECFDGERRLLGKANLFPVADEKLRATKTLPIPESRRRATAKAEAKRERPLLLHPYLDDPERHLEFVVADDLALVQPRKARNGRVSAKGRATIDVLGLQRPGLVNERSVHLKEIQSWITTAANAIDGLDQAPNDANHAKQLRHAIERLETFCGDSSRYAGMARQFIRPFLAAVTGST